MLADWKLGEIIRGSVGPRWTIAYLVCDNRKSEIPTCGVFSAVMLDVMIVAENERAIPFVPKDSGPSRSGQE